MKIKISFRFIKEMINIYSKNVSDSAPLLFLREGAGTKRAPLEGMSFLKNN
jgi:hypothetical protein